MTEHERLMYEVLGKISATDAPIVFKGALITRLVLAENGYTMLDRITRDIDANWTDTLPSMDDLVGTVQKALDGFPEQLCAVAIRKYDAKKSAGISIKPANSDKEIISMDISVKPSIGSRTYHYREIRIRGVLPNEILADKIAVLSSRLLFRRAKDIVDVYALTHCIEVEITEIYHVLSQKSAALGEFLEMNNRHDDIEHAYGKLRGIEGKPPFSEVYPYMQRFLSPFALKDETPRVWNSGTQVWDDSRQRKPSMFG